MSDSPIDAEEADRLDISLDVIAALASDPQTRDWRGLGLAVQAYGKRARYVVEWVEALARATGRRMTLRLVKGAYWDTEIKRAQERGLSSFPVLHLQGGNGCELSRLRAPPVQCAAMSSIRSSRLTTRSPSPPFSSSRRAAQQFEFQRLHGMGEALV